MIISWSAEKGQYSLIWNAVRLFADNGYGVGKQLNIKFVLFHLLQPIVALQCLDFTGLSCE